MKEILAKFVSLLRRFFCLFKLTISCKLGFKDKEDVGDDPTHDQNQEGSRKDVCYGKDHTEE